VLQVTSPESGSSISACPRCPYRLKGFCRNWFNTMVAAFMRVVARVSNGHLLALVPGMPIKTCHTGSLLPNATKMGREDYWHIHWRINVL